MPFGLLKDFAESGVMPNTASIIADGTFRKMLSSIPEVSCVAWSSIITGSNPAEHGIFGFTDFPEDTYRLSFPNFNNLKVPPFWQKNNMGKSVIINVPSTYPVRPMNGVHISGFVSLDFERSVYPSSLIPKLKEIDYRLDVDSEKAHKSLQLFLSDLDKTLKARIQTYRYLWDSQDWQIFMLVFTGTDRLLHFLWDAYENPNHKYHSVFSEHFHQIDQVVGEVIGKLNKDDVLIMLSDHGFELLEKNININYFLRESGFLKLQDDSKENFSNIDFGTKAFALDPARIYVNLKGKYPRGSVPPNQAEGILSDLIDAFDWLEIESKKVVRKIYQKEEVYKGPFINQAPDLVLLPNKGFNLKASMKAEELCGKAVFTGKHTYWDAFLLVDGDFNKDIIPENPSVFDMVEIMEKLEKIG